MLMMPMLQYSQETIVPRLDRVITIGRKPLEMVVTEMMIE